MDDSQIGLIMFCKICNNELNDSNRCEAHIVPRSLLKRELEEDYGNLLTLKGDGGAYRSPIGTYETEILCRECDNHYFSYLEDEVCKLVDDSKILNANSNKLITLYGYDQEKIKLMGLSCLWRASVSKRSEFKKVDLGKKHEAIVKDMIINKRIGDSNQEYLTLIKKFTDEKTGMLFSPFRTRIRQRRCYIIYLSGSLKMFIKVDSAKDIEFSKKEYEEIILDKNKQELNVLCAGNFKDSADYHWAVKAANDRLGRY